MVRLATDLGGSEFPATYPALLHEFEFATDDRPIKKTYAFHRYILSSKAIHMRSPEYNEIKRRITVGIPFKAKYHGGAGGPEYHVLPGLIGTTPVSGNDEERFLGYKYVGVKGHGWRCFRVSQFRIGEITNSSVPVPSIDPIDEDMQNCIVDIDV